MDGCQRGHDVEVSVGALQLTLFFAEVIVRTINTHGAGLRPNLEEVQALRVRVILAPRTGHLVEILPVVHETISTIGAIGTLVVLSLMPKNAADAVVESGSAHTPK